MVVVIGCDDQRTEGDEKVEKRCARFVMNGARSVESSSNVMIE